MSSTCTHWGADRTHWSWRSKAHKLYQHRNLKLFSYLCVCRTRLQYAVEHFFLLNTLCHFSLKYMKYYAWNTAWIIKPPDCSHTFYSHSALLKKTAGLSLLGMSHHQLHNHSVQKEAKARSSGTEFLKVWVVSGRWIRAGRKEGRLRFLDGGLAPSGTEINSALGYLQIKYLPLNSRNVI